jgi:hypothetical protein
MSGAVTQVVEQMSRKHKALSSNPSIEKKKKDISFQPDGLD